MTTSAPITYVFGDSLSDQDNALSAFVAALTPQIFNDLLASGLDPATAASQAPILAELQARTLVPTFGPLGAITNEFTYVGYAAQLGAITPANFAVASARAVGVEEPFGPGSGFDINLGGQLDRFAAATPTGVPDGANAIVFIGANDLRDAFAAATSDPGSTDMQRLADLLGAISTISGTVIGAVGALHGAGISTTFFSTIPLASFFAGSDFVDPETVALADFSIATYNDALSAQVAGLQAGGIDARIIDFAGVASAITEDPSGFGIVAPRTDFLIDGSAFDSDQILAWDSIHPTEVAHQVWGAYLSFTLNGGTTSILDDAGTVEFGGSGADAIFALGGDDRILARRGDDVVFAGSGDDMVHAGHGADIVSGGSGNDRLFGKSGDDIVDGGEGDDTIIGGRDADILLDGLGNDKVFGGQGDDTFIFVQGSLEGDASATSDLFVGGSGNDTLLLVLDEASFAAYEFADTGTVLDALGIRAIGIETVTLLNGRGAVEDVLGGSEQFMLGDFWGLLPAPTDDPVA